MRRVAIALVVMLVAAGAESAAAGDDGGRLVAVVEGNGATVGDRIPFKLCLSVPEGASFVPQAIGPELGPFTVAVGAWKRSESERGECDWSFDGAIAGYEPGTHELPGVRVSVNGASGPIELSSEPIEITIESVLVGEGESSGLDIADIKDPLSIAPDHRPLLTALAGLGALLAVAVIVWWLHGRYAARLSVAPSPPDPFLRMSPDEWAFQELKALLARRLHEHGQVDEFHAEVARILKRYLGGRFRVDLLECTTAEVRPALRPAGAEDDTIAHAIELLGNCDTVKFARARPDAPRCRELVDEAYRLIDATRSPAARVSEEGAA